jgi:hypothetical protein
MCYFILIFTIYISLWHNGNGKFFIHFRTSDEFSGNNSKKLQKIVAGTIFFDTFDCVLGRMRLGIHK